LHQKCPCPQVCATEVHSQLDAIGIPPLKNGKNIYKSFDLYKINYCAAKSISATNASAATTSAMQPLMSAIGNRPFLLTLLRKEQRESTTMLLSLMLLKNLSGFFIILKPQEKFISLKCHPEPELKAKYQPVGVAYPLQTEEIKC